MQAEGDLRLLILYLLSNAIFHNRVSHGKGTGTKVTARIPAVLEIGKAVHNLKIPGT